MQITNATISNAKKVKEGIGEYGNWTLWNVTIDGKKYALFQDDEPHGVIAYAEVEEKPWEKDGKKGINLSLKDIKWGTAPVDTSEKGSPEKANGCGQENGPYSMLLSYAKDMVLAHPSFPDMSLAHAAQNCLDLADFFRLHKQPEPVKVPRDDKQAKYVAWLKSVVIPPVLKADLESAHGELSEVTDRADQESIYKAVTKALKEAEVDPFA